VLRQVLRDLQGAERQHREAPPGPVNGRERPFEHLPSLGVPLRSNHPPILVLYLAPPLLDLLCQHVDAHQQVQGLEAGDDLRHPVGTGELGEHIQPGDGGHVPRLDQAVDAHLAHREQRPERRGQKPVAAQHAEVLRGVVEQRIRRGRAGRLEADGHEHHPVHLMAEPEGVLHRIHDPHVRPLGLDVREGAYRGRDGHHVPEDRDGHPGLGQGYGLHDLLSGGHADRAARALPDGDPRLGEHPFQAEPH